MSVENMKTVSDPSNLEDYNVFEIIGPAGSGKTTFARQIGEFCSCMGQQVYFFQTTPEDKLRKGPEHRGYSKFWKIDGIFYRFADHENHIVHLCEHGVIKPDLIIMDEFYLRTPEGIEKTYSRLESFARKHNCKILVTRQCGIPHIDYVEIRAYVPKYS